MRSVPWSESEERNTAIQEKTKQKERQVSGGPADLRSVRRCHVEHKWFLNFYFQTDR